MESTVKETVVAQPVLEQNFAELGKAYEEFKKYLAERNWIKLEASFSLLYKLTYVVTTGCYMDDASENSTLVTYKLIT